MYALSKTVEIGLRKHQLKLSTWFGIALYVLLAFGPFLILSQETISSLLSGQNDLLALAIPTGRRLNLLMNSLLLSVGVAGFAMIIGWCGAVAFWITRRSALFPVIGFVLPLVVLPPYIQALTWISLVSAINDVLPGIRISSYGFVACLWVEVSSFAPLAFCFAWFGLRNIDPELIEVARVARADWEILRRVVLPIGAPAALTGGALIFLLSLLDYSLPSLLQFNVYSLEIFAEFNASHLPVRAFVLSLPLMIISVSCVVLILKPIQTLTLRNLSFRAVWTNPPRLPRWFRALLRIASVTFIIQIALPVINLTISGSRALPSTLMANIPDMTYSFYVAGLAALIALPIALLLAKHLFSKAWTQWFVFLLPVAIPAALIGIGYTSASRIHAIRGSQLMDIMPAFVGAARFLPLAVIISIAQLRRVDTLLFDASLVFQQARWRRYLLVALPVLMPGLLTAFGTVFALTLGELGATLMVMPPGRTTLTTRVYNYLHYGASDAVAGLCLVLMLIVFGIGVMTSTAFAQRNGSSSRNELAE